MSESLEAGQRSASQQVIVAAGDGAGGPRPGKACVECHSRKVKCDAPSVGIPCSRCVSKGYPESCALAFRQTRKRRRRRNTDEPGVAHREPNVAQTEVSEQTCTASSIIVNAPDITTSHRDILRQSGQHNTSPPSHLSSKETPSASRIDLSPKNIQNLSDLPHSHAEYTNGIHYLSILSDAIGDKKGRNQQGGSNAHNSDQSYHDLPEYTTAGIGNIALDPVDFEYLSKKGAFLLPPQDCLKACIKAYFDFVHPYAPVMDKREFLASFKSGHYSPFLMQTMLTGTAFCLPPHVISSCGFADRSQAQSTFFSRAVLLYDFQCEKSQLRLLQGSVILGTTAFFYPIDRDVNYWFYNAVRLATKLDVHKIDMPGFTDSPLRSQFRRVWWVLYCRDVLLSYAGIQSMALLSDKEPTVDLPTIDEWETEDASDKGIFFTSSVTYQQKAWFIEYCRLSVMGAKCLSAVRSEEHFEPEKMARQLIDWRMLLRDALQIGSQDIEDRCLTVLLAASYRFECILFRILRVRWKSQDEYWYNWAKQRLRSSMFELDTLVGRVLANDQLRSLPLSFKSCIPTVLALHIETALDASESSTTKSMSMIYIRQGMLILEQLQDIPVFHRALAVFDWVLKKQDLLTPPLSDKRADSFAPATGEISGSLDPVVAQTTALYEQDFQQFEPWFGDFLGFGFLDNFRQGERFDAQQAPLEGDEGRGGL